MKTTTIPTVSAQKVRDEKIVKIKEGIKYIISTTPLTSPRGYSFESRVLSVGTFVGFSNRADYEKAIEHLQNKLYSLVSFENNKGETIIPFKWSDERIVGYELSQFFEE